MRNLILFDDDENWRNLLPLTLTRPISELRIGIHTIKEKWELIFDTSASYITQDFLAEKYSIELKEDNVLINSSFLPTEPLRLLIEDLSVNEAILYHDELVCARLDSAQFDKLIKENEVDEIAGYDISNDEQAILKISRPNHIFGYNGREIINDFNRITKDRIGITANATNTLINPEQIFIEEGAKIDCAILNASEGPIYIGKNATVMEGSIIRGPFAMNEHAQTKMGAKIYSATTLGPHCKVGGELSNVVLQGYSSKAHDGYLGNSVIGEWCNIGAGTSISNLKNNYDQVKVWSYVSKRFERTGLTFHGLIMGDHSKIGINSMINTGTVMGVNCNIYGSGFPRNYVPSFSWGGHSGFTTYDLNKAFKTAEVVMARRNKTLTELDRKILNYIFLKTAKYRTWE